MSNTPQLEDGFLRIANELMDAILSFPFTHREQSVLFSIIRKTYGYGKKEDDISASQIGTICKIGRQHVTSTLNQLAARNVITKRPGDYGAIIGVQKDHRKWVSNAQINIPLQLGEVVPNQDTCPESGLVPNRDTPSPKSGQVDSPKSGHTKDNLPKDNHQKKKSCASNPKRDILPVELAALFEKFYAAYPRKKSRQAAERMFAKINPDEQLVDAMIASIERAMTSAEWSNPKFIPHPASWLNAGGWMDEVQTHYSDEELEVIRAFNLSLGEQLGNATEKPFIAERAAAIRDFRTFSQKPGFVEKYFPWARDNVEFPPKVGFDWVISRQGFTNVTSGQHSRRNP